MLGAGEKPAGSTEQARSPGAAAEGLLLSPMRLTEDKRRQHPRYKSQERPGVGLASAGNVSLAAGTCVRAPRVWEGSGRAAGPSAPGRPRFLPAGGARELPRSAAAAGGALPGPVPQPRRSPPPRRAGREPQLAAAGAQLLAGLTAPSTASSALARIASVLPPRRQGRPKRSPPPSRRRTPRGEACFPARMMDFSARSSLPATAVCPRLPRCRRGGEGRGERSGHGEHGTAHTHTHTRTSEGVRRRGGCAADAGARRECLSLPAVPGAGSEPGPGSASRGAEPCPAPRREALRPPRRAGTAGWGRPGRLRARLSRLLLVFTDFGSRVVREREKLKKRNF